MNGNGLTYYSYFTPAGPITIAANGRAITRIALGKAPLAGACAPSALTNKAATQVQEYLAGKRTSFTLPLSPCGTPFQQQVWNAVADIPYAQTATAADIACRIGHAGAHRAVGAAVRMPVRHRGAPAPAGSRQRPALGRGKALPRARRAAQTRAKPLIGKVDAEPILTRGAAAASASHAG